jgi:hypothetical protein
MYDTYVKTAPCVDANNFIFQKMLRINLIFVIQIIFASVRLTAIQLCISDGKNEVKKKFFFI